MPTGGKNRRSAGGRREGGPTKQPPRGNAAQGSKIKINKCKPFKSMLQNITAKGH